MLRCPTLPLALAAICVLAAGCSRDEALGCDDPRRYASAETHPPLQVPDDLTVPDETEALRVPDASVGGRPDESGLPCLESPPDFFVDGPGA